VDVRHLQWKEHDMATFHDMLVRNYFVEDIKYCDQSATPPKNAQQTNALLFRFEHNAPNQDTASYKGLLIYSPPFMPGGFHPSLGTFKGTGALRSGEGPPPWVRILISMRRSNTVDEDGFYRYFFTGGLTFLDDAVSLPQGPGGAQQVFECDFELNRRSGKTLQPIFMMLKNAPQGHTGEIRYRQSTVVP